MTMNVVRRWYPVLGLAVVLSVYWVPVLVALGWGTYFGGDLLELVLALQRHLPNDLGELPLTTSVFAPLVLLAVVASALSLRRGTAARRIHIATLALATPYVLIGFWWISVVGLWVIACWLQPCRWLF